jgi:3-phosphoshikimate 1-carboxyvinyltransferase
MRAMGADVVKGDDGVWTVAGVGVGGLAEPASVIDMGNAGTGVRLLMGLVATHPVTCTFTGDASLSRRPMERVMGPLRRFGTRFTARDGGLLPITVAGAASPVPVRAEMTVPSAQVKSAVLLAGLNTPGETCVVEKEATRDHTENMLRHFRALARRWRRGHADRAADPESDRHSGAGGYLIRRVPDRRRTDHARERRDRRGGRSQPAPRRTDRDPEGNGR